MLFRACKGVSSGPSPLVERALRWAGWAPARRQRDVPFLKLLWRHPPLRATGKTPTDLELFFFLLRFIYLHMTLLGLRCHVWAFVAMCGPPWRCVGLCGHVWASVTVCGPLWPCVGLRDRVWASVAMCGPPWPCVGLCGHVWCSVTMRGPPWPPVSLRGRAWACSAVARGGYPLVVESGLLTSAASLAEDHGLQALRLQYLWLPGSRALTQ